MLHEVLMTLSGVSGSFLKELMENDRAMGPGEHMLIKRVLDISSQYTSIKTFIDRNMFLLGNNDHKGKQIEEAQCQQFGMYLQAFCNGLREVLVPYHEDIVELEEKALEDPYLPVLTVISKVEEYSKLFGILNYAISQISVRQIHGCQILDFLQGELNCSDDVKGAVQSVIHCCQLVFLKQLSSWLLYGQLIDRYGEFFIQPKSNAEGQAASTSTTLDSFSSQDINEVFLSDMRKPEDESGYHRHCLRLSMLPSKLDVTLAQKILFIGENILIFGAEPKEKSDMLFISSRYTSSIWGNREVEFHRKLQDLQTMKSFKSTEFEKTISEFRSCVTEHLWKLAVEEAELFLQLKLMKDFFLLGRGELFLEFICQAGRVLQNPPLSTSTRDVNQALHLAAQKIVINEDIVNKFNLLIPYKADIEPNYLKENCWEKLRLNYAVSWPLHTLFDNNVLENYNKLFNFLLQVKRTQLNLHSIWKNQMKSKTRGVMGESSIWHLRNNLMFLIDNLQYYFQVDVLESQYTELQAKVQMTKDFEEVQKLHNKFLSDIMSRTFLSVETVTVGSETKPNPVNVVLKKVLNMGEKFCASVHSWDDSLNESEFLELHDMVKEYECLVMYLLRLLSDISSYSCGSHLSQFLLRLDFNRWFSTQHNIVSSV